MRPEPAFLRQEKPYWAFVRTISQAVGYTQRGTSQIKVPSILDMAQAMHDNGLSPETILYRGEPTQMALHLRDYFAYRAEVLNLQVEQDLMDADEAREMHAQLSRAFRVTKPIPMNKQKGEKKAPAYLTAMVNLLIEQYAESIDFDHDPRRLTTVTFDGSPVRTLARRVDGAFPTTVNPIAVWEIKEYYYTTTFGSRVADGVYETLLDGMELEELREHEGVDILHYLMVDSHFTWWECGRSYLCRIVDMLHMGYVDEVFFGREIERELPRVVRSWVERNDAR